MEDFDKTANEIDKLATLFTHYAKIVRGEVQDMTGRGYRRILFDRIGMAMDCKVVTKNQYAHYKELSGEEHTSAIRTRDRASILQSVDNNLSYDLAYKLSEEEDRMTENKECLTLLCDRGLITEEELVVKIQACFMKFIENATKLVGEDSCRKIYDYAWRAK